MEEYFDVLTREGDYTGKIESREKCHKEGLWHKAVAVFIMNSKNQVLLQKRSVNKKLWPNLWDMTAGGHVLAGEFGFQSIIREIKEEIGINVDKSDILFIGASISDTVKGEIKNRHYNEYYIVNKEIGISELKLQTEEVSDAKWFDMNDVIKRIDDNYNGITEKIGCWNYFKKYCEWKENNS